MTWQPQDKPVLNTIPDQKDWGTGFPSHDRPAPLSMRSRTQALMKHSPAAAFRTIQT